MEDAEGLEDEPPFTEDDTSDEGEGDDCDVPTDIMVEFMLSGGESVPDGYALDESGNLCIDTAAEEYGMELEEPAVPEEVADEGGRGKRCRIANKRYSSSEFWKH